MRDRAPLFPEAPSISIPLRSLWSRVTVRKWLSDPVYIASGVLLGASCVAIARHAGIDLFRTGDPVEEAA